MKIAFVQKSKKFYERYKIVKEKKNKKVFYSSESDLWPFGNKKFWDCEVLKEPSDVLKIYERIGRKNENFPFLNAGVIFGEYPEICKVFEKISYLKQILPEKCQDDQAISFIIYLLNQDLISLDDERFIVAAGSDPTSYVDQKNDDKENYSLLKFVDLANQNKSLFILHGNGYNPKFRLYRKKIFPASFNEDVQFLRLNLDFETKYFQHICPLNITSWHRYYFKNLP